MLWKNLKGSNIFFLFFVVLILLSVQLFAQAPFREPIDTTRRNIVRDTIILPGPLNIQFLPEQDSAYLRAKRLAIPPSARLYADFKLLEREILLQKKLYGLTDQEIAKRNLQIPSDFYLPLPQEVTMYQYGLMQSQYVPFVPIYKPFGMKVPLSTIGSLFGFTEDVSPWLEYELDVETDVRVAIYSEKALLVATIVNSVQQPGRYRYYWNGRDDNGKLLPRGDYIGEIRIGKTKYIRKRIRLDYQ
ncbi:MAG: FlgD immunoglobulin-like domain containing protein [Candidatus Kapaibacteriota bacterium]